ncbi:MAG TPA: hypothetical protein VN282_24485 [Pyrinomonadaceae bacterium]|nr:hypothetical protein [Pyrinomonadaceae bacterium]
MQAFTTRANNSEVFIPNVEGAGDDQNCSSHAQVYSYDWLNRLTSAAESGAGEVWQV